MASTDHKHFRESIFGHTLTNRIFAIVVFSFRVWQRNLDSFKRQWRAEAGGFIIEPIVMLSAMTFGLGGFVGSIDGISYGSFVTPGIIVAYAMFHSAFEATYGAYMRMETHRLYDGILTTPVAVEELILGEVVWAATRSVAAGICVLTTGFVLGLVHSWFSLLTIIVAFFVGIIFASLALTLVSKAGSLGTLNNFFTVFITPMFFFSGIFFPLTQMPQIVQTIVSWLPLAQASTLTRHLTTGQLTWGTLIPLLGLLLWTATTVPIAIIMMRRRIIR